MSDNKKYYFDLDSEINPKPVKKKTKKKKSKIPKRIRQFFYVIGTTLLSVVMVAIITICIVATALVAYIMQFADTDFDIDLKNLDLSYTSFIYAYDNEGNQVEIKRLSDDINRIWVDIEQVPEHTQLAFVAAEDKRFFEHEGVDWRRTITVTVSTLFNGYGQGGSTITQQLIKNITGDDKVSPERKIREIFRALELETKYTKIDILESYLNRIPMGSTVYGIGTAAYHYFGKTVDQLTLAESAILAGLTPSPSVLNPYADLGESRRKQLYVLQSMYEQGLITTDEYEEARNEKVKFRLIVEGDDYGYVDPRYEEYYGNNQSDEEIDEDGEYIEEEDDYEAYRWDEYEISQNWYVDAAIEQVIEDIAEKKLMTYEEARTEVYKGGYKIYLNMDMDIQNSLEEFFNDPYNFLYSYDKTAEAEDLVQAAFVLTDYKGRVIAIAGGIGDKPGDGCFNRATQAILPIGSTMKPISVYGQAIDKDLITYSSMVYDRAIKLNDGTTWPSNFEGDYGTFNYYPAWFAVQQSKNTMAVRVCELLGINTCFNFLVDKLGATTLDYTYDKAYSPIALGQLTNGMPLVELAGAFQIFGNGGVYHRPLFYSVVTDFNDEVVLESDVLGERVISSDSAYITNRMLKTVVDATYGTTGRYAKIDGIEVVGKTGTSNDERVLAFAGLTPDYVGVIRMGYDDNQKLTGVNYIYMAQIWNKFMKTLVNENSTPEFAVDPNVEKRNYCTVTGLIATSKCPSTAVGYYKKDNMPKSCDCDHSSEEKQKQYITDHTGGTLLVPDTFRNQSTEAEAS